MKSKTDRKFSKLELFIASKIGKILHKKFGWGSMTASKGRCNYCGKDTIELIVLFNCKIREDKNSITYLKVFPSKCKRCNKLNGQFTIFKSEQAMNDFNKSVMAKYN
jgi:hypothetical protein